MEEEIQMVIACGCGNINIFNTDDRGFKFERNCVLRRWESETLK